MLSDEKMVKTIEQMTSGKQTLSIWKDIYRELLYKALEHDTIEGDIHEIESTGGSVRDHMYQALVKWQDVCGGSANGRTLIKVLKKLKCTQAAGWQLLFNCPYFEDFY